LRNAVLSEAQLLAAANVTDSSANRAVLAIHTTRIEDARSCAADNPDLIPKTEALLARSWDASPGTE
jgi:hypothetical protein